MHHEPNRSSSAGQFGEDNPNWRGGRVVASNGYVLIRVGVGHPMADVRGYAYEHRVVASESIGRSLEPGELVHHRNGIRDDNRPENLEIVRGNAEHFVLHRRRDSGLRMPGEPNREVQCQCGCGTTFPVYDNLGRPREYVSGHNPQSSPSLDAIRFHLSAAGEDKASSLARKAGTSLAAMKTALSKYKSRGVVTNRRRGYWSLTEHQNDGR